MCEQCFAQVVSQFPGNRFEPLVERSQVLDVRALCLEDRFDVAAQAAEVAIAEPEPLDRERIL
jgi:hypothetical protein